jgi:hypothetical protein
MLEYIAVSQNTEGEQALGSGIAAYENGDMVACIQDITPNHQEAEQLAALLNQSQVSLVHFHDIVEDYVAAR